MNKHIKNPQHVSHTHIHRRPKHIVHGHTLTLLGPLFTTQWLAKDENNTFLQLDLPSPENIHPARQANGLEGTQLTGLTQRSHHCFKVSRVFST